jgi:hypothetical protein
LGVGSIREGLRSNMRAVAVTITAFLVLSTIPALAGSDVKVPKKVKKPRFEQQTLVVKDNKMGLMWPVNAYIAGRTFSWYGAQDYVYRLNTERLQGFGDWRVPTLQELQSLIEYIRSAGFDGSVPSRSALAGLQKMGMENVQRGGYWTATESLYLSSEAWYVNMENGSEHAAEKSLYFSVWPVRSVNRRHQ